MIKAMHLQIQSSIFNHLKVFKISEISPPFSACVSLCSWFSPLTFFPPISALECSSTTIEKQLLEPNTNEETVYSCELCGLKLGLVAFLKHQRSHVNDFPYKCSQTGCKKKFKTLSEFRTHKRVSHKPRMKNSSYRWAWYSAFFFWALYL